MISEAFLAALDTEPMLAVKLNGEVIVGRHRLVDLNLIGIADGA